MLEVGVFSERILLKLDKFFCVVTEFNSANALRFLFENYRFTYKARPSSFQS